MSTGNIIGKFPDKTGGTVVFQCRSGEQRSYHYNSQDFAEIALGSDPKGYSEGEDDVGTASIKDIVAEAATDALEIL